MILIALVATVVTSFADPGSPGGANEVHAARPPYSLEEILDAIRMVETGGQPDGGRPATGDGGRAIGPYQIHREHWLDSRVPGRYEDCRDPLYSRRVVIAYWQRWCPDALARCDAEVLARVHNGGPRGHEKTGTRPYWERVRVRLERACAQASSVNPPSLSLPGFRGERDAAGPSSRRAPAVGGDVHQPEVPRIVKRAVK